MILSLLSCGHTTQHKECVYPTLVAKQNVSAQIITNEQKVFVRSILKTVLFFEQIKTADIWLTHDFRGSFDT